MVNPSNLLFFFPKSALSGAPPAESPVKSFADMLFESLTCLNPVAIPTCGSIYQKEGRVKSMERKTNERMEDRRKTETRKMKMCVDLQCVPIAFIACPLQISVDNNPVLRALPTENTPTF